MFYVLGENSMYKLQNMKLEVTTKSELKNTVTSILEDQHQYLLENILTEKLRHVEDDHFLLTQIPSDISVTKDLILMFCHHPHPIN